MVTIDEQYTAACFTPGPTQKDGIAIHWWDRPENNPTMQSVINTFVSGGRQTSAHFAAEEGYSACFVNPDDVAWANGNWDANLRMISIECNPRQSDGDYLEVAGVIQHIRSIYGDLPLHRHSEFFSTECCGTYDLERLDALARGLPDITTSVTPAPPVAQTPAVPAVADKTIYQLADEVLHGAYGTGDERRIALGSNYDAVQAVINSRLAGFPNPQGPNIAALADQVLAGAFGNGDQRRTALGSNYQAVQDEINSRLNVVPAAAPTPVVEAPPAPSISELADQALAGAFGNGDDRKAALGDNYDAVQAEINSRLGAAPAPEPAVDISAMADAVLRGEYGDGDDRRAALGEYYDAVQAEVNSRLG